MTLRNRVIAGLVPRTAFQQPHDREPPAANRAIFGQGLDRVRAATGLESAGRQSHWGYPRAVQLDQEDQRSTWPGLHSKRSGSVARHHTVVSRRRWAFATAENNCCATSGSEHAALPGKARITTIVAGSQLSSSRREAARNRRATRWRITELPTDLPTMRPTRGPPLVTRSGAAGTSKWITTSRRPTRTPCLRVRVKSDRRVIRFAGANTSSCGRLRGLRYRADSGRQARASLATTSIDDRASSTGAHTQPEAMHTCATTVVRLESPFALGHGQISSW